VRKDVKSEQEGDGRQFSGAEIERSAGTRVPGINGRVKRSEVKVSINVVRRQNFKTQIEIRSSKDEERSHPARGDKI
jgi:hypothetical protein